MQLLTYSRSVSLVRPHDGSEGRVLGPPEEQLLGPDHAELRDASVAPDIRVG